MADEDEPEAALHHQIVEEKKASLRQQQTKHSEDKANLPRQITIHKATVDSRKANVDSAKAQLDTALLNLTATRAPGQVFTMHAELEGMRFAPAFEQLLIGWKAQGWTLASMRTLLETLQPLALPR